MNRRHALIAGGIATTIAVAGCLEESVNVPEEDQVTELARPVLGDPDSDIVIEVFEDYSCPACQQYNRQLFPVLKEDYIDTNEIAYKYYDWPIPVNGYSYPTANVARFVQDTVGEDAFWEFKEKVYHADSISGDYLSILAGEVGADEDGADYARHGVYTPVIDADREYGNQLGVSGTPTILVNGERPSPLNYQNIEALIAAHQ